MSFFGRSPLQLERTVAKLRRVLERVQAENERLKCAPGPVSVATMEAIQQENRKLTRDLSEAKRVAGAGLAERRLAADQNVAKLSQEYDRLRIAYEQVE
ncbi:unnamed protein product [Protopolystoma xenopodis]|uniref:Uncharacterized protein n=1 Tax=Protopolystoma xenopodis TaxID=117903 RepID=A0A448X764_9PLAT|nr:unnamed protein product [Protopolystoma xenopodis]